MLNRRQVLQLAGSATAVSAMLGAMPSAQAQTYPSRPITLLVPFAPGGGADVVARLLGEKVGQGLGQNIVVDNRPGAGGTVAASAVARAEADGHTLLFVTAGHAGIGALYPKLPFDPVSSFAPVIGLITSPVVVVVNAQSKYQTIQDLVADAQARPGELNYAAGGGGATVTNLAAEVFRAESKLDVVAVPYKGSAPALVGLIAGETDFCFDAVPAVLGYVKGSQLRPLAVTSSKRSGTLPDVPTIAETIVPGFDAYVWYGILAPQGTPAEIIQRLNEEFNAVLRSPEMQARLRDVGADPLGGTPAEFGQLVASETARWSPVIERLGLKPG
jgi:tripartite-type tricarboxylate transporter receptor subunit TctC